MKDIAIYGAGGFGREVACLIQWINQESPIWNFIGFFDDGLKMGTAVSHFGKVLGGINELNQYDRNLSIAIAIGNGLVVSHIVSSIHNNNVEYPNLIAPDFILRDSDTFSIGRGNIIKGKSIASCDISIGNFNVFNGDISLGHDVQIGDYNMFMPSVRISGGVNIADYNFFGVGSIVLQQLKIGNKMKLAAGSVLMTKPKSSGLYIGVPAKLMKF